MLMLYRVKNPNDIFTAGGDSRWSLLGGNTAEWGAGIKSIICRYYICNFSNQCIHDFLNYFYRY